MTHSKCRVGHLSGIYKFQCVKYNVLFLRLAVNDFSPIYRNAKGLL